MSRRPLLGHVAILLVIGVVIASGCRSGFDVMLTPGEADSWDAFVTSLDIRECPTADHPDLLVNTIEDQLDGGTALDDPANAGGDLSLSEALWISFNRMAQDPIHRDRSTIRFDPSVFPPRSPATIHIIPTRELPAQVRSVCIDGRGAGVQVTWDDPYSTQKVWGLFMDTLQVGLTFLAMPSEIWVSGGAKLAGCRIGTDGLARQPSGSLYGVDLFNDGSRLGPGNVVGHRVRTGGGGATGAHVEGNFFGWDPVTRSALPEAVIDVRTDVDVVGNTLRADTSTFSFDLCCGTFGGGLDGVVDVIVTGNHFGVAPDGTLLGGGVGLTAPASAHTGPDIALVFGPDNIVRHTDQAVLIDNQTYLAVRLTRNDITDNRAGIVYVPSSPVAPPVIANASRTHIEGSCAESGTVEVFADSGFQGAHYLGSVVCDAVGPWQLDVEVPVGESVTATLTRDDGRTSPFSAPVAP